MNVECGVRNVELGLNQGTVPCVRLRNTKNTQNRPL